MTQERLAEYPDVSVQQLHKYEAGKNRIAVGKLVRPTGSFGGLIFRGIRIRIALIIRVRDIVMTHILMVCRRQKPSEYALRGGSPRNERRSSICLIQSAILCI